MNKIAEDYQKYLESINPIMQYERLKARQEKDAEFIENLQNAVNKLAIQFPAAGNTRQGSNERYGNFIKYIFYSR